MIVGFRARGMLFVDILVKYGLKIGDGDGLAGGLGGGVGCFGV